MTDVTNIFRTFWNKRKNSVRTVFSKTLEFYLNALKFDPQKILEGLTEEITILKREMEERKKIQTENLLSWMERISLSKEQY